MGPLSDEIKFKITKSNIININSYIKKNTSNYLNTNVHWASINCKPVLSLTELRYEK